MSASFTESVVEEAVLARLEGAGWSVKNDADIAPGEPAAETLEDVSRLGAVWRAEPPDILIRPR